MQRMEKVEEEVVEIPSYKKYAAEFIGTFVLVLVGCGSAVIAGAQIGFLGISFAFGIAVLAMVYAIGPISGCHINPAITLAMLIAKKIKPLDALFYVVVQVFGAIFAAGVLYAIASGHHDYSLSADGLGANQYGDTKAIEGVTLWGYNWAAALLFEVVFTAIFLLVIFGATHEKAPKGFAGLAIGLALTMIHIVGIPITGTSVNPARSIGPAFFVGNTPLEQLPLFIIAPLIGASIAALIWVFFFEERKEEAEELPLRGPYGRRDYPRRGEDRFAGNRRW